MFQGHRGANHPVKRLEDGRVEITSMNHGFAVEREGLPENVRETHVSLFDNSNCGIELKDRPAFSVQYHPEASPGPQDSFYLFEKFVEADEVRTLALVLLPYALAVVTPAKSQDIARSNAAGAACDSRKIRRGEGHRPGCAAGALQAHTCEAGQVAPSGRERRIISDPLFSWFRPMLPAPCDGRIPARRRSAPLAVRSPEMGAPATA